MTTLIIAILLVGSLPALLPKWRHVLLTAGILLAALIVAFIYLLNDLGANPSGGDGPAFATLIILFGCAKEGLNNSAKLRDNVASLRR